MAFILVFLGLLHLVGNFATAAPSISDERFGEEKRVGWMKFPQTGEDFTEGDIKLPPGFNRGAMDFNYWSGSRWPGNTVAYTISSVFSYDERTRIKNAIQEFESRTCLKFVERTTQNDYINIKKDNGCWSYVGHIGGPQDLSLGQGCLYDMGTPIHELMHAIGFFHEHNRPDRDNFVTIHWDQIYSDYQYAFYKRESYEVNSFGSPYDYGSVMHYEDWAFQIGTLPTITSKPPGITLGQRNGFSEQDVVQINKLYGCSSSCY
ncbi:unnamed protein product [Cyprideis torosa]|uniref:Metalloendopeptidase n=1 Tax=Cyprideis torosa TaxID=163714 RepID=A0A7R8WT35_9CRUS|nr:unnamed protein product [Cyprideis torosa]CAG0904413.1 unnamed protein product [Cyprideis torosa]